MKKLLIILLFTLIPMSLFGFYGDGSGKKFFIDFSMDKDQLRARTDQIGFLYGTEHIRVAFGVTGNTSGVILDNCWTNDSQTNRKLNDYFRPLCRFSRRL